MSVYRALSTFIRDGGTDTSLALGASDFFLDQMNESPERWQYGALNSRLRLSFVMRGGRTVPNREWRVDLEHHRRGCIDDIREFYRAYWPCRASRSVRLVDTYVATIRPRLRLFTLIGRDVLSCSSVSYAMLPTSQTRLAVSSLAVLPVGREGATLGGSHLCAGLRGAPLTKLISVNMRVFSALEMVEAGS